MNVNHGLRISAECYILKKPRQCAVKLSNSMLMECTGDVAAYHNLQILSSTDIFIKKKKKKKTYIKKT